jgi:APA family basic amino acid/polyamine antiporter
VGRGGGGVLPLAILAIVVVAVVNYLGVKPGSRVLNAFVVAKLVPLAFLIGAGLFLPVGEVAGAAVSAATDAATGAMGVSTSSIPAAGLLFAMGAALIPVMFSYGGWQNANYVAEEMKDPVRDMPVSLLAGTALVVVVYGLVNWVYLRTLGHAGLASTLTPASDAAQSLFGPLGEGLITLGIAVSTFGFLNLTMLAPTRVYYAMARDGLFPESVARLHPRFDTPSVAIIIQTVWAVALVLTGTYAQLVDYVVSADWIFFGLAGASLFVFRRKVPLAERPPGTFATPWFPLVPGLFVVVALLIVGSVMWTNPLRSAMGFAFIGAGVPAYLFWSRRTGT